MTSGGSCAASSAEQTSIQAAISPSLWSPTGDPPAEDCCATADTVEASHIISPKMAIGGQGYGLQTRSIRSKVEFAHGTPWTKDGAAFAPADLKLATTGRNDLSSRNPAKSNCACEVCGGPFPELGRLAYKIRNRIHSFRQLASTLSMEQLLCHAGDKCDRSRCEKAARPSRSACYISAIEQPDVPLGPARRHRQVVGRYMIITHAQLLRARSALPSRSRWRSRRRHGAARQCRDRRQARA
jgi:hypothetical protein